MIQEKQIPHKLRSAVLLLLLLTPALTNLLQHAGSGIMSLLTVIGIYTFYTFGHASGRKKFLFSPREKTIMGVFALYFGFSLVMIVAHNLYNGISILKTDVDHELRMLTFIPIYYLFVSTKPATETIWYSVIAGAIASGIYALATSLATGFSSRIIGPYNPCLFGYFSVALAFMSLSGYRFFYQKNKKLILLPLLGFVCGLLAAFFSGTRGSVITIPFLLVIFIFQIRRHLSAFNTKIILGAVAAVLVFLLLLFPHTRLAERFEKGVEEAENFFENHECVECFEELQAHHLRMWMEALIIIRDHPLAGVGPKGYRKIITERTENRQIAPGIEIFKTPHNMYLTMLTAYGAGGLIVLMAFFLVPLAGILYAIRNSGGNDDLKDISYCGLFLIAGYMLFSMTGTLFIRNMLTAFYVIMLAAVFSAIRPALKL